MEHRTHQRPPRETSAAWPYGTLLIFGFFGTDTPAGKRFARRTTAGVVLIAIAAVTLRGSFPQPVPDVIWILTIPAAVAGMAWATARYLADLDELSRMIQLKAYAFSYGAAMVFVSGLLAYSLASPSGTGGIGPGILAAIFLVEGLRGVTLVVLARRYQ